MKKMIVILSLVFTVKNVNAQWLLTGGTSGNIYNNASYPKVGIGNTAPTTLLDVGNTTKSGGSTSAYPTTGILGLQVRTTYASSNYFTSLGNMFYTNAGTASYGLVTGLSSWVNTSNTGSGVQLRGLEANLESASGTLAEGKGLYLRCTGNVQNYYGIYVDNSGTFGNSYGLYIGTTSATNNYGVYTADPLAKNYFAGKVSIGTNDPVKIGSYTLAVNGDAIFNRVKVKLYANWPDYVFDEKYKLTSLQELEQYIKKNKHLPNVPAAEEMQKNGIDVATANSTVMQKVEELTLYIIEINKKLETLQKENETLKAAITLTQKQ